MSQNGYAFCGNNPINFIDPTGHWQESDKKYDSVTQQKIIKATNDYYAAKTPEGREAAHDAANAARKAGDKNGKGLLGKTVNTFYNTQTGNKGYVTGNEWKSTLTSATKLLSSLSGGSQVNMTGEKRDHSLGHAIMDVVGLVPGFGEPFDLINTISYLAEGDHKNAGLSAASMIPIAGTLKGLKYADEAASLIKVKRVILKAGEATPNGYTLTKHAAENANNRGFTLNNIDNTILSHSQKVYQPGGQTVYAKKNGNYYNVVIINKTNQVITVVGGNTNTLRTWNDVTKMLNNNGGYSSLPID